MISLCLNAVLMIHRIGAEEAENAAVPLVHHSVGRVLELWKEHQPRSDLSYLSRSASGRINLLNKNYKKRILNISTT